MQRTAVNPWSWSLNVGYNQGEIIEIYKNARAFDETNIKSQNKVNFVIELKSGMYPLQIGDKFLCPLRSLSK